MADIPEIHDIQDQEAEPTDRAQIARERVMLAGAADQYVRGEVYDWPTVKAWMRALEADADAKLPPFSRKP